MWASGFFNLGISQPAFALNFSLPKRIISLSWDVSMHGGGFHGCGVISVVFLVFLPLLVFPRFRKNILIKFMLFYSAAYFILWAMLAPVARYIVPILPLLGIIVGYTIEQTPSFNKFFKRCFYTILILTFLFQIIYLTPEGLDKIYQRILVFAGLKSQEEYILRNEATYAAFKYINENSSSEAKVWILYEPRTFYCNRPYTRFLDIGYASSAEKILVKLKKAGITYFVLNQYQWERRSHSERGKYPPMIEMLNPEHLYTIYDKYPFIVWKVSYPESFY